MCQARRMRLWEHSAAELLVLPDDALGLLVLAEFGSEWNVHNFLQRSRTAAQCGVPES